MEFKYQWREQKHRKSGSVEFKYMCPLMRGEHRPTVLVDTVYGTHGLAGRGPIYATSIHGYTRQFHNLDEAKAYVADVPMQVGGFIRGAQKAINGKDFCHFCGGESEESGFRHIFVGEKHPNGNVANICDQCVKDFQQQLYKMGIVED